jgi:hypothetical protein
VSELYPFEHAPGLDSAEQRAYETWCRENGLSRFPEPPPSRTAALELAEVEKRLWRANEGLPHAATWKNRRAIEAKIEALEQRADELYAVVFPSFVNDGSSYVPPACDFCGAEISERERYLLSSTCPTCIARSTLGATPTERS